MPGRRRPATNHATVSPATIGTAPADQVSGDPGPGSGTTASSGNAGSSGPDDTPSGPATLPPPSVKPGPSAYAAPHTAAFGTSAAASRSTASRPDHTSVICSNECRTAPMCHTVDAATTSAPPAKSMSTPAAAARAATGSRRRTNTSRLPSGRASRRWRRRAGSGVPGRPWAVQIPAPAAATATTVRCAATLGQDGRSSPPDA